MSATNRKKRNPKRLPGNMISFPKSVPEPAFQSRSGLEPETPTLKVLCSTN